MQKSVDHFLVNQLTSLINHVLKIIASMPCGSRRSQLLYLIEDSGDQACHFFWPTTYTICEMEMFMHWIPPTIASWYWVHCIMDFVFCPSQDILFPNLPGSTHVTHFRVTWMRMMTAYMGYLMMSLCTHRMDHDTLDSVTNLIKGDPVFKKRRQCPKQMLVKQQLMIFVHFIGREGENITNQQSLFNVSEGHCEKAWDWVMMAS